MANTVQIINPSIDSRWMPFILKHRHGAIYHHPLWKELITQTCGYEPFYLVLERRKKIRAALPFFGIQQPAAGNRMVSLPHSDFCDPLVKSNRDFEQLMMELLHYLKMHRITYLKFKTRHTQIDLPDFDLQQVRTNTLRVLELEKIPDEALPGVASYREEPLPEVPVTFHFATEEREMRLFYHFYTLTRRQHQRTVKPYKFFKNVWQLFYPQNLLTVLLGYRGEKPVGGMMLFRFKDTVSYLYGGFDTTMEKFRTDELLLGESIRFGKQRGYRFYETGKSVILSEGQEALLREMGAAQVPVQELTYTRLRMVNKHQKVFHSRLKNKPNGNLPDIILTLRTREKMK